MLELTTDANGLDEQDARAARIVGERGYNGMRDGVDRRLNIRGTELDARPGSDDKVCDNLIGDGGQQSFLAVERLVEVALRQPSLAADVTDLRSLKAGSAEHLEAGLHQPTAAIGHSSFRGDAAPWTNRMIRP